MVKNIEIFKTYYVSASLAREPVSCDLKHVLFRHTQRQSEVGSAGGATP